MAQEQKHALYLQDPDSGHVQLVHADDIEAHEAKGWKQPTSVKPNGEAYNREDELEGQDAAANGAKSKAEADAKKAADAAKADEPVKAQDSAYKAPYDPSFRPQS